MLMGSVAPLSEPVGNVTVPVVVVKSAPGAAVPAAVSYATVIGQVVGSGRGVVSVTDAVQLPAASGTLAVAAVTDTVGAVTVARTAPSRRPAA